MVSSEAAVFLRRAAPMTIDIAGPDGSSFQFPDGTDYSVIKGALDKHYNPGKPSPISADNLVRAAGRGVPILGGLLDKANAATYAALQPAYASIAPETEKGDTTISHAPSFGERYTENLGRENVKDMSFAKEHPLANTTAEVTGGIASTAPLAATAWGARLLGLTGKTLPQAITRGAASSGAISAADALARGEDPIASAGIGTAVGAGAPVVGRVLSTVAAPVTTALRGIISPADEAARRVASGVSRDVRAGTAGLTEPELLAAQQAGSPVTLMDTGGETTRALARSAANTSPEGFATLNKAINDRYQGQGGRIAQEFQSGMHYPTDASREAAITHVANNEVGPKYMAALKETAATQLYPTSEVRKLPGFEKYPNKFSAPHEALLDDLSELTQAPTVQQAIRLANTNMRNWGIRDQLAMRDALPANASPALRNFLSTPPKPFFKVVDGKTVMNPVESASGSSIKNLPTLQYWDYIKRALDQIGTPESRAYAKTLRNNLDEIIPAYKTARDSAQPVKFFQGAGDAHEAGMNFFRRGDKFDSADTQKALANMSDTQKKLFQDGYSQAYVDFIEKHPNRRNLLNEINKSPAATRELETALGAQRARDLEAKLRVEHIMDASRGAVQGNSTTARQLMQLGLAGGVYGIEGGGLNLDPNAMMHAALIYGAARGKNAVDTRVARQVAELLTSADPAKLKLGMQLLGQKPAMMNGIRQFDAALASVVGRGSLPALTGP